MLAFKLVSTRFAQGLRFLGLPVNPGQRQRVRLSVRAPSPPRPCTSSSARRLTRPSCQSLTAAEQRASSFSQRQVNSHVVL